ncbi:hypothetical protein BofuT4_uP048810.1 [Botrytis cinerea T4]|uniref:Uncharacterized protein n=1 Tax=Botryotinia fuckeliana (strain T4) TaxID=999810 RepID=G2XZH6_BOTF4|nr:hypothetical protein BofuT4_uP048810.1 [Botrytis cinerea T4]
MYNRIITHSIIQYPSYSAPHEDDSPIPIPIPIYIISAPPRNITETCEFRLGLLYC